LLNEINLRSIREDDTDAAFRFLLVIDCIVAWILGVLAGRGRLGVEAFIKLSVDQSRQIVEESHDELGFVVVTIAELTFGLDSFLCRDERDRSEILQQSFPCFRLDTIFEVVFVEEVVRYLGDVRMAAVLGAEQD